MKIRNDNLYTRPSNFDQFFYIFRAFRLKIMFIMWLCILFKNLKTFDDTFIKSWWFSSNQEYPKISNFLNKLFLFITIHHSIGDVHQFIVHCFIPSGSLFKKSFLLRSNVSPTYNVVFFYSREREILPPSGYLRWKIYIHPQWCYTKLPPFAENN